MEKLGGFSPKVMPSFLYDFQKSLVEWALKKERAAIFADCGLGKTAMQLTWAQNIIEHTNKPVLILTPLSVSFQTVLEGKKFGFECEKSTGYISKNIIYVTNYEKLHHFNYSDFAGVVCDESSCMKNFDGQRSSEIVQFMRQVPYRLLCTATAAPNDFIELGTSSEALGYLGYMDMLSKFFKNDQNSNHPNRQWGDGKWRFRGHAERDFWRWMCSWARAVRKPSDIGFSDTLFKLPELNVSNHLFATKIKRDGLLFALPAHGLKEQREEKAKTLYERCEYVSNIINNSTESFISWCHLNNESKEIHKSIKDSEEVSGSDSDESKEQKFIRFLEGKTRVLVTKSQIAGFGLNWQHCHNMTFFPSHSYEQYYQAVRRCWRFGQKNKVNVHVVATEGEQSVLRNLERKGNQCDVMFERLVSSMNNELNLQRVEETESVTLPNWI